jgi:hypothetical protein
MTIAVRTSDPTQVIIFSFKNSSVICTPNLGVPKDGLQQIESCEIYAMQTLLLM